MDLLIQREPSVDGATIGQLFVGGRFQCFTLEPAIRDGVKIVNETAIDPGRYRVIINKSRRFGKMLPLIIGVQNFTGVRIHSGNVVSDTAGCVLVGQSRAHDSIEQSKLALSELQPQIAGALARHEDVFITIQNPVPVGAEQVSA